MKELATSWFGFHRDPYSEGRIITVVGGLNRDDDVTLASPLEERRLFALEMCQLM